MSQALFVMKGHFLNFLTEYKTDFLSGIRHTRTLQLFRSVVYAIDFIISKN